MEKVFLNDKLVSVDEGCVAVTDSGFLYGAGLFETMRSCKGVVFALGSHLNRLFSSAEKLDIYNSYDRQFVSDAVYKVLEANELAEARLRLTISSGSISASAEQRRSTLLISATKYQGYPAQYYSKGVMVVLNPFRQNTTDPTCGHKTTNYLSRMMGLNMARQRRATEALWFTEDNRLAEGCVSNVFVVKNSIAYTPMVSTPILPGIARQTVCELAVKNSIELVEKDLTINDVLAADEIFLTNVIMKVLPIIKVEKHTVGDGAVGEVTEKLGKIFDDFVEESCGQGK